MLRLLNGSQTCSGPLLRSQSLIGRPRSVLVHSAQRLQLAAVGHQGCDARGLQRRWNGSQQLASQPDQAAARQDQAGNVDDGDDVGARKTRPPIREYLALWDRQNAHSIPQPMPHDSTIVGSISNDLTRTQSTGSSEMDNLSSTRGGMTDDLEGEESDGGKKDGREADQVLILGAGPRKPGDLIELRATGSRVPLFAIYLGFFGERNHFYAANGRWITARDFSSMFTVSGFATADELAPLLAKIPLRGSPEDFDELRFADKGPSRPDAAVLLEKMRSFRLKAQALYQAHIEKLDAARRVLSQKERTAHLSLTQIAEKLLPESCKKRGKFPAHALFAIHVALSRSELGFRPLNPSSDCHRPDNLIEIFSKKDMANVEEVAEMLRAYSDQSAKTHRSPRPAEIGATELGRFLQQARRAVFESRSKREWTPHGILKPSSGVDLNTNQWSTEEGPSKKIIRFLEWWASHDIFEPGSRFHNYGAMILRALKVYDESVTLDQSTAWTFLQEIGVIRPWDLPSRYKARLPGVDFLRDGGLKRDPFSMEESQRTDIASGCRRKHDEGTTFCIDAPSTILVDDGVSLERTNKPDEYWIHVHTADPASGIKPDSELSKYTSFIPQNIYLPGHFQAMLPSDNGEVRDFESVGLNERFSLKPGSPALTFSAKLNKDGEMLEFDIKPSNLGDVVYIDPKEVAEFCGEPAPPPVPARTLTAGRPPKSVEPAPNRAMVRAKDLDPSSKEDLRVMYRLAEAVRQKRLQKGAWPYFFPGPSVSVSPHRDQDEDGDRDRKGAHEGINHVPEDPYIKVSYDTSTACSIVSNLMVLAGEIAARWCSSRGIPIPYRRDIRGAGSAEHKAAHDLATGEIYPLIARGIEPSFSQRLELSQLIGGVELSSEPGPYFILGLDMYAKATSPLRRFSDLLAHWQIHAALRHERQTQRPVDPSVDNLRSILPFFGPSFDDELALLQLREKIARTMSRGSMDWILMALVRAWRFEGRPPKSLRFTVRSHLRQALLGRLDLFNLAAVMDVERLGGLALIKDVRVGDQFKVELADVNVHSRQILVKAVKILPPAPDTPDTPDMTMT